MSKFRVSGNKSSVLEYPTIKPELSLDFVNNPKGINSTYSFTRNSSATYVDVDGSIKTVGPNIPRFDYDPITGEYKGLLIEESRTNYYTTSETMLYGRLDEPSQWTWTSFTEGGPQGGSYIRWERLDYSAIFSEWNYQIFYTNIGLSIGDKLVVTFYARCPNGTLNSIKISNPDYEGEVFNIDSQWRKFTKVFTYGIQGGLAVFRFNRFHDPSYVIGATYDIACLQIEKYEVPTSYIPTNGSTATRQPDQLVLNKTLSPQGTLFIESNPTQGVPLVVDNGTSTLTISQPTNQYTKSVLYYNTNRTLTMSSDNTAPVETNTTVPQNLNRVSLGFDGLDNTEYINGHIKKFSYYSNPLTEDNLRALTDNKLKINRGN